MFARIEAALGARFTRRQRSFMAVLLFVAAAILMVFAVIDSLDTGCTVTDTMIRCNV